MSCIVTVIVCRPPQPCKDEKLCYCINCTAAKQNHCACHLFFLLFVGVHSTDSCQQRGRSGWACKVHHTVQTNDRWKFVGGMPAGGKAVAMLFFKGPSQKPLASRADATAAVSSCRPHSSSAAVPSSLPDCTNKPPAQHNFE